MFKLISLFFVGIFIISCGGETGTTYHNGNFSDITNTNPMTNTGNTNTADTSKEDITCLPGVSCDNTQSSTDVPTSSSCLPGVDCLPSNQTNISQDTNTHNSSNATEKVCLPGAKC